jgi:hypothetical protein
MKRTLSKVIAVAAVAFALSACGGAPKKEDVAASIKKIMPVNFEVVGVSAVSGISGLFEVLVKVDKQPVVLYVNKSAKLVVSGSIVDVDSKQNLTLEAQKKMTAK